MAAKKKETLVRIGGHTVALRVVERIQAREVPAKSRCQKCGKARDTRMGVCFQCASGKKKPARKTTPKRKTSKKSKSRRKGTR